MKRDTLLIIDDSSLDLAILNEIFKHLMQVKCLSNANMAVSFLKQNQSRICAILLDICLGRKGAGFHVLQKIHTDTTTNDIPIILITSDASRQYVLDGIARGAADFLVKPVDPHTVQQRVCSTIRSAWPAGTTILDTPVDSSTADSMLIPLLPSTLSVSEVQQITNQWKEKLRLMCQIRPAIPFDRFERVQHLTEILAEHHADRVPDSLSAADAAMIGCAALFYDIGLLALPDAVITAEEEQSPTYLRHTDLGRALFEQGSAPNHFLTLCAQIAEFHHQNIDGSGYPANGQCPPLCAQLVRTATCCDKYLCKYAEYSNPCDRMLNALRSETGKTISEQMLETVQSAREAISAIAYTLYGQP